MSRPAEPPRDLAPGRLYRWVGRLGATAVRLWGSTLSIDWIGDENIRMVDREGERVVYAFWHGCLLTLTYSHRRRGIVVLVSRHHDGEIISQIICRLGYGVVRGSSTRGGLRALLEMARVGARGHPLAVTPDGPRGPRHALQSGILHIAQRSGRPIVPLAVEAVRRSELDSWDRFMVPHPFSRVVVAVGRPIWIPPELDPASVEEIYAGRIEEEILENGRRAVEWRARRVGFL